MATPPAGPSLGRQAFSAVAWLSALNGLGGVGMIALVWWLNRALPDAPMRMGQWSVVLSLLLMTSLIFEGGITAVIQQRKELGRDALATLAWLQVMLGAAGALTLSALASPIARLMASDADPDETARLIRLASWAVLAISAGLTPKGLLQRELSFRTVASIEGGCTLITILLAIVLVPRVGIAGMVWATIARHVLETLLYWSFGDARPWSVFGRPAWSAARDPLRAGASMGLQSILGTLVRQGDVLLIGALAGTVQAGVYRQIQQLVVQPYAKLTLYVGRAAFPALSRVQDDPARMLRGVSRMQRLLALCVLPLQFGLAGVAPRLLAEYLGIQYQPHLHEAIPAMMLLCLAAAIASYAYSLVVALNAAGQADAVLGRQAAGSVAMLALMALGALFGLVGIAAGRVVAATFHATILVSLAERAFRFGRAAVSLTLREAVPAAVACLAVALLAGSMFTRFWPESAPGSFEDPLPLRIALLVQMALGALAYVAALLALGIRPRDEWRALRGQPSA